jgi:hypothetical protein
VPVAVGDAGPVLLERDAALNRIDQCLHAAGAGRGSLLLLEGFAGIGKTRLVLAAARRGRELALATLSARGSELEGDFTYGVVRQLLEAPLVGAPPAVRTELLAGILERGRPLRFVHPIVRAAIEADLSSGERAGLHARAARHLAGAGASADRVAAHLLATDPVGDHWVVESLRAAQRRRSRTALRTRPSRTCGVHWPNRPPTRCAPTSCSTSALPSRTRGSPRRRAIFRPLSRRQPT